MSIRQGSNVIAGGIPDSSALATKTDLINKIKEVSILPVEQEQDVLYVIPE